MLLVQPDASFIAPTGSFSYLSGSFFHVGTAKRLGDTIITGSVSITGSFESSLQENYIWLGNSNNRSTAVSASSLTTFLTGSFTTLNSFNTFTSSIQTQVTNLTSVTSSYLVGSDTGSLMATGSLSGTTLTFEKGDSSTFDINLGASFHENSYLSIFSSASQALVASGSEQLVTFTSQWASRNVSLEDNSKIRFASAGVYEFNFVAQVTNSENAVYDSWFWIKYNGSNFPNSTTQMTLQARKNASTPSAQLVSISIIGVAQNDNDYIELYWTGEDTGTALTETPAGGVVPETPSIIASIKRVG